MSVRRQMEKKFPKGEIDLGCVIRFKDSVQAPFEVNDPESVRGDFKDARFLKEIFFDSGDPYACLVFNLEIMKTLGNTLSGFSEENLINFVSGIDNANVALFKNPETSQSPVKRRKLFAFGIADIFNSKSSGEMSSSPNPPMTSKPYTPPKEHCRYLKNCFDERGYLRKDFDISKGVDIGLFSYLLILKQALDRRLKKINHYNTDDDSLDNINEQSGKMAAHMHNEKSVNKVFFEKAIINKLKNVDGRQLGVLPTDHEIAYLIQLHLLKQNLMKALNGHSQGYSIEELIEFIPVDMHEDLFCALNKFRSEESKTLESYLGNRKRRKNMQCGIIRQLTDNFKQNIGEVCDSFNTDDHTSLKQRRYPIFNKFFHKNYAEPADEEGQVDEEDCAICLDEIDDSIDRMYDKSRHTTSCKHYFHKGCLRTWFSTSFDTKCPLCRSLQVDDFDLRPK